MMLIFKATAAGQGGILLKYYYHAGYQKIHQY